MAPYSWAYDEGFTAALDGINTPPWEDPDEETIYRSIIWANRHAWEAGWLAGARAMEDE